MMQESRRSVLIVAGTRPEVIKLAPVLWSFERFSVEYVFVWSGQHYDYEMSRIFFEQLGVPSPHTDLQCGSGSHAEQTARMMSGLEKVIMQYSPSIVVAQGDTNTVVAAALTATKMLVPFAHVEAGLRSWNMTMPEEVNRKVADAVASLHFAPTKLAVFNLVFEGVSPNSIYLTGNTIVDVVYKCLPLARKKGEELLSELGLEKRNFILVTVHRAENTDNPERISNIIMALEELSKNYPVVFPMHPRTRRRIEELGLASRLEKIKVLRPLGYFEFLGLLVNSRVVLTDSGGVQEEAFTLKIPTVTLRYNTERPETTMYGLNKLAGAEKDRIVKLALEQAMRIDEIEKLEFENPLGDGHAGERIARILKEAVEGGISIVEPDLRNTPLITYALLENVDEARNRVFDIIVGFDERGEPKLVFRDSWRVLARIKKGFYDPNSTDFKQ